MIRRFDSVRSSLFRQALIVIALWVALLPGGALRAERVNYAADDMLSTTRVNISSLGGRLVTLDEIFTLVESQTKLKFIYIFNRIPIDGRVVFTSGNTMSLAQLFSNLSSLANVVFLRQDLKVIVRRPLPESSSAGGTSGQQASPATEAH